MSQYEVIKGRKRIVYGRDTILGLFVDIYDYDVSKDDPVLSMSEFSKDTKEDMAKAMIEFRGVLSKHIHKMKDGTLE